MGKKRILIIDDDQHIKAMLKIALKNYNVFLYDKATAALSQIKEESIIPHLIITDFQMPEMDGLELTKGVKACIPNLPVIIMTGRPDLLPEKNPADGVLKKPFYLGELFNMVDELINY